jgi:hypothetical protein
MELFEYVYNSNNMLTEEFLRFWDSNLTTPIYVDNVKTVYSYDSNNKMVEYIEYFWLNNSWGNSSKFTISYNSDGKISEGIQFNWIGADWVLSERTIITYGVNGNIYNLIYDTWDGSKWVQNEATEFTLDANNKIILEFVKAWDGTTYLDSRKTEYQYDTNGNQISEKVYYVNNGVFELNYGDTYTFDTSLLMSSYTHPFNQTTGLDYVLTGFPFVNKLLSSSNSSSNRIVYNYGETTANTSDFNTLDFVVYPNPTSSLINVDGGELKLKNVVVYNLLGKKVMTSTKSELNLQSLVKGLYLLKVQVENGGVVTMKIVKM